MKKGLFLSLLFLNSAVAETTATLDRTTIGLDETVNLTISTDQERRSLDFDFLRKDFEILSTSTENQWNVVNGVETKQFRWVVTLFPKHTGNIPIPSIQVGSESTSPLTLTVQDKPVKTAMQEAQGVFLEGTLNTQTLYVGMRAVYTAKIYYASVNLQGQLIAPQIDQVMFSPMGQDQNYQAEHHHTLYNVAQRQYAFSPHQAGKLTIPGAVFEGVLSDNASAFFGSMSPGKPVRFKAPAVALTVKPLPAEARFAAYQATLTSHWEPADKQAEVGKPLSRWLRIEAKGIAGEGLPDLAPVSLSTATAYADQPQVSTRTEGDDVIGMKMQKIAYVPQQSGELTLPPMEIHWINAKTGKLETLHLPAEKLTVKPSVSPILQNNTASPPSGKSSPPNNTILKVLVGVFAFLWIGTLAAWGIVTLRRRSARNPKDLPSLYPE